MNKFPLNVMAHIGPNIKEVEENLKFLIEIERKDKNANVPLLENVSGEDYKNAIKKVDYWRFMQSADQHYFMARVLGLHGIFEYSRFYGYQCIENYLKAYLKYKGVITKNTHKLSKVLLVECQDIAPVSDDFIHSDFILIIIKMYEPFYELARYPVQNTRPNQGKYGGGSEDIFILDYFVLKMRQILSIPENTWDILRNGHVNLHDCHEFHPEFYNVFFFRNINFIEKIY
jgi:HEPN domain-containing protein